jgi:uncharacterized protein YukE
MLSLTATTSLFPNIEGPSSSSSPTPPLSPSPAPSSAASPTPNSLLSTPSPLPPSSRDFEIHRLALVEFLSTRRIAEKFKISQTRVRQIIGHVAEWMTEMLPLKSEQDIEKEKRYAIHLAAAQLQNQIEQLQYAWDGSSDPKYQRQQTRAIVALARLGVSSHHLDALASRGAGFQPAENDADTPLHSSADSQISSPKSEIPNSPTAPVPCSPSPSFEDCSPHSPQASCLEPQVSSESAATPSPETDLLLNFNAAKDTLAGFDIAEKNLLKAIDNAHGKPERQAYLQESLTEFRTSRANYILELSPKFPSLVEKLESEKLESENLAKEKLPSQPIPNHLQSTDLSPSEI